MLKKDDVSEKLKIGGVGIQNCKISVFIPLTDTSGIMLLTKLVNETSEIKDYQLMKEIIDHMNSEFVSLTSFSDAKIIV